VLDLDDLAIFHFAAWRPISGEIGDPTFRRAHLLRHLGGGVFIIAGIDQLEPLQRSVSCRFLIRR